MKTVLLIGGGGYVGAELQKKLAMNGLKVRVFDTFWYPSGKWQADSFKGSELIEYIDGDVRDLLKIEEALREVDYCIHLACISNDPTYELNPTLALDVNYEAFKNLIPLLNKSSLTRFIYASSSSVYGVKQEPNVTEELSLEPLSDYSKYKAQCEKLILENLDSKIVKTILRPSTVCGYSKRQRFDLVVNILTKSAYTTGQINVDGGDQFRPNLHINDMVDCYFLMLKAEAEKIDGEIFNVAGENLTVNEIANLVKNSFTTPIQINFLPVKDQRSYRVSGDKIKRILNFEPKLSVLDAIKDLINAFESGKFRNPEDSEYYNIRRMKEILTEAN